MDVCGVNLMDIETEFRKLVARVEKLERATFTLNEKPKNDSAKG